MSMIEDVRQIFQDFLAPELRALAAQMKAASDVAEAQSKLVQSQLEAMNQRMEAQNRLLQSQLEAMNQKMESLHRESMLRSDTLEQKLTARMDQMLHSLELEKRLLRLEERGVQ